MNLGGGSVSTKEEPKDFIVSFGKLGSGACVLVDWKDGTKGVYGDRHFCRKWASNEEYVGDVTLEKFTTLTHTY